MKFVATAVSILLVSCSCVDKWGDSCGDVPVVEVKQDRNNSSLSAILAVASENADKPSVVKNELGIASAYLPLPSVNELNLVRQRVQRNDTKEYEAEIKKAKQANIEVINESEKLKKKFDALASENHQLKTELTKSKSDADRNLYSMASVCLLALGGVAIALGRVPAGAGLFLSGIIAASIPYLLDSPYYLMSVGGLFVVAQGFVVWHLFKQDGAPKQPTA